MQITRDDNGDFVLDPTELSTRFGLSRAEFKRNLQMGLVASTVEIGEGDDSGLRRLSLRIGNRIWRALLDESNTVLSEEMTFARAGSVKRTGRRILG
ncbi:MULTISPECIES: DUF6522 family protein [Rhizobium]|uniref:Uncharacterized protein n=1 Tax=Rhizobium gallicum bv. gallicum R602sp TaxID=1041138 RepID=A0A0B4XDT2_9HYPH|nr:MULTISPECIES: DUF6522 family protein [Rhizobium]AJD46149.1 hypothetical protein RGR602_PC02128 [Rhizobium gallicum bv. gallicum R602sp]